MIIAVTLLRTAEKITVITPYRMSKRRGSPPDSLVNLTAIQVKRPDLLVTSTKREDPTMIAITSQSTPGIYTGKEILCPPINRLLTSSKGKR